MSKIDTEPVVRERELVGGNGEELEAQHSARAAAQPASALFAGISGAVDAEQLRARAATLEGSGMLGGAHLTLAYPGADTERVTIGPGVDLLSYPLPSGEGGASPWVQTAAAEGALLALSAESQAQATVVLHPDLAALSPSMLMQLARPILTEGAGLVMAGYTQGPFDSLVTHSILAPLTRALYGKRVRYPLAPDFALAPRVAARLAMSAHSGVSPVLWPTTVAAGLDAVVVEAELGLQHPAPPGVDLSAAITQLAGSAFAEMEAHAPLWQRIRPAVQAPTPLTSRGPAATEAHSIDTGPMINSFLLGSRSLQDVWGMVLPPVSLLDLKRLALLAPDKFRMPDELWVRIIYDFALSYRLRTINRTHLLGALTPLYLGWVASFVNEAKADPAFIAEARTERLARAFEDGKPYLVRRWRWPDRFNP